MVRTKANEQLHRLAILTCWLWMKSFHHLNWELLVNYYRSDYAILLLAWYGRVLTLTPVRAFWVTGLA